MRIICLHSNKQIPIPSRHMLSRMVAAVKIKSGAFVDKHKCKGVNLSAARGTTYTCINRCV